MNPLRRTSIFALLALALATPALAHHPGTNLDEVMGSKEKYFQAFDSPATGFELADAAGRPVQLADYSDKVVVMHFIYAGCIDVCPLHADRIAEIQGMINESPMKDMVQFITITTDPGRDTAEVLLGYGAAHGFDDSNWIFLTTQAGQPEDTTRTLAKTYGLEFTETDDAAQVHGVVTLVIDRGGRLAAKFHGLRFEPLNLVLYVNGLVNNANTPEQEQQNGFWDWVTNVF